MNETKTPFADMLAKFQAALDEYEKRCKEFGGAIERKLPELEPHRIRCHTQRVAVMREYNDLLTKFQVMVENSDTLFAEVLRAGIPYANHESDLYIPVNEQTSALIKKYDKRPETFVNQVEGGLWYDVPFAYLPEWIKRIEAGKLIEARKQRS